MWCSGAVHLTLLIAVACFYCGYSKECNGHCHSSGDPHYQTFDCNKFEYHGTCSYTLVKSCDENLPYFEIIGDNEALRYHPKLAYTKSIIINTDDEEVKLTANKGVYIDGVENKDSLININKGTILKEDNKIIVKHDYGFSLTWGSPSMAEISITNDTLKGKVCGMCGNANSNPDDDLHTPTKQQVKDVVLFGDSWNTEDNCKPEVCKDKPDTTVAKAKSQCQIFKDKNGILAACFSSFPSSYFHNLCLYEMCGNPAGNQSLCEVIDDYVSMCQSNDIFVNETVNIESCSQPKGVCDASPCDNGGTCKENTDGNFTCLCTEGWTGEHCNETCSDKNSLCQRWAGEGYCGTYVQYMRENCPVACGVC